MTLEDTLKEIQSRRDRIYALSPDDLRREVAGSLDLDTWPGDAAVALRLLESYGANVSYSPFNRTWQVIFLGTNGAASGYVFREALFRAWLMFGL